MFGDCLFSYSSSFDQCTLEIRRESAKKQLVGRRNIRDILTPIKKDLTGSGKVRLDRPEGEQKDEPVW
ncbi:MAG: hypothetical protein C4576_08675 [Desulfobacteraceae bacterium]|nr:MAG: hypothetical protein C4576_08675 [Desulfobacteraceae bacterium]